MQNVLLTTAVPFDGDASPVRFGNCTTVGKIASPIDAITDLQSSRLFAGHLLRPFKNLGHTGVTPHYLNQECRGSVPPDCVELNGGFHPYKGRLCNLSTSSSA